MPFNFGDIVLVPFPFTNQASSKKRPAVVVSNAAYNGSRLDIVVMAVTSQQPSSARIGDAIVQNWQSAGLLKPSVVKPVFATIEQRLVIRTLGRLVTADLEALRQTIAQVIG